MDRTLGETITEECKKTPNTKAGRGLGVRVRVEVQVGG